MSRVARVTRCTAAATTLAAGVLAAFAWAAPAQAAGVGSEPTHYGTQDFVWPAAPDTHPLTADDFVWPIAPGHGPGEGSPTPDDFVWPTPPAAS